MLSDTRCWSEKFVIKHPWHDVVSSVQFKYPNPYNLNVLNIDVINRQIHFSSGVIRSCKLINSSWPMFHMGQLKALEYSCIQVPEKRMVSSTINIDFQGVLNGTEHIEYIVHPENENWTILEHSISVKAFSLIAMSAISMSKQTAHQGRQALNWVIDHRLPVIRSSFNGRHPGEFIPTKIPENLDTSLLKSVSPFSNPIAENLNSPFHSFEQVTLSSQTPSPSYQKSSTSSFFSDISKHKPPNSQLSQDFVTQSQNDSLESRLETFSRDVTYITDTVVKRSQRVARLFSRIDEYVVIF
ncbi:PRELI domain containing protein [Schistosoma japonicum]|uniref:PRELI domain containing protein n=1 Tax=Schistosoma japonicum TaxID=6182 RepID=C1L5S8_SCHJA|nr:cellular retinaldehyde-binding protein [Schistosoma japonicum]KAH8851630.1 cellular retinaldehyde-binding protein [Schistosoma japonicum]TNN11942.1 PRELI domain containing protein [Schistosoma japonicum]TNN11943.1 PRELI domain containing protein [Schistosoma japonicum]CAX70054.1 putative cellular retinaldehyde-binding protein [Schistosoma japonicum]